MIVAEHLFFSWQIKIKLFDSRNLSFAVAPSISPAELSFSPNEESLADILTNQRGQRLLLDQSEAAPGAVLAIAGIPESQFTRDQWWASWSISRL